MVRFKGNNRAARKKGNGMKLSRTSAKHECSRTDVGDQLSKMKN